MTCKIADVTSSIHNNMLITMQHSLVVKKKFSEFPDHRRLKPRRNVYTHTKNRNYMKVQPDRIVFAAIAVGSGSSSSTLSTTSIVMIQVIAAAAGFTLPCTHAARVARRYDVFGVTFRFQNNMLKSDFYYNIQQTIYIVYTYSVCYKILATNSLFNDGKNMIILGI